MEATSTASYDGEHRVAVGPAVVARDALFETLSAAERAGGVTLVSAPAGSGKTILLRSWLDAAGLRDRPQKWRHFTGSMIEQVTKGVLRNWVFQNLRRISRDTICIVCNDPSNILSF